MELFGRAKKLFKNIDALFEQKHPKIRNWLSRLIDRQLASSARLLPQLRQKGAAQERRADVR
jgi:hypothetical protein